jgi:hypothetical protein
VAKLKAEHDAAISEHEEKHSSTKIQHDSATKSLKDIHATAIDDQANQME